MRDTTQDLVDLLVSIGIDENSIRVDAFDELIEVVSFVMVSEDIRYFTNISNDGDILEARLTIEIPEEW